MRLVYLTLLALASTSSSQNLVEDEVDAPNAQEYLGRHTYFRSWVNKRRLFIVRTNDAGVTKYQRAAIYGFRCPLALRNVNLVLLGDTFATETVFYHSEDNRRDFIHTRYMSRNLRVDLVRYLHDLYRDLPNFRQWALLLGYDGGRKRMYRRVNFPALVDKIDSMPLRQREKMLQKTKNIECKQI